MNPEFQSTFRCQIICSVHNNLNWNIFLVHQTSKYIHGQTQKYLKIFFSILCPLKYFFYVHPTPTFNIKLRWSIRSFLRNWVQFLEDLLVLECEPKRCLASACWAIVNVTKSMIEHVWRMHWVWVAPTKGGSELNADGARSLLPGIVGLQLVLELFKILKVLSFMVSCLILVDVLVKNSLLLQAS